MYTYFAKTKRLIVLRNRRLNVKSGEEENITSRQRQGMSLERGRIRGISNSNVSYAPAISRVINTALLLLLTLSSMAETVKPQRLFEKKGRFQNYLLFHHSSLCSCFGTRCKN